MNIVLYEPQIPQNTGNIARTCALTGTALHLIEPLGFSLDEKQVRRAGLDYWELLDLHVYQNFAEFLEENENASLYFLTTHATRNYDEVKFLADDFLVFGKETAGLPEEIHAAYPKQRFRIPMQDHEKARSLNLSNAAAIVLYEALRQNHFPGLI